MDNIPVFEVGAMVSESVGRKSVGATLYFKSPKEGMKKLGELENDSDIIIMTSLITEEVHQFVEVFAVLVEPVVVEGLPIRVAHSSGSSPPIVVIDDVDNDGYGTDYSSSSGDFVFAEHPP